MLQFVLEFTNTLPIATFYDDILHPPGVKHSLTYTGTQKKAWGLGGSHHSVTAYYAMVTVSGSGLQVASSSRNSFCCPKASQALANQLAPCPSPLHPILSFQLIGPGTTMPQMEITIVYGCSEENKA